MKTLTTLFLSLLISGVGLTNLQAQNSHGTLGGIISAIATGEALPFVDVIVKNANNEIVKGGISDINGIYTISSLAPGKYTLEASSVGLSKEVYKEVEIKAGQITTFNILLLEETIRLPECVIAVDKPITICCFLTRCVSSVSSMAVLSEPEIKVETFEMYPNPSNGELNISTDDEIEKVLITNMNGQQVAEILVDDPYQISANLGHLPPATYVVHFTDGQTRTSKLWILAH